MVIRQTSFPLLRLKKAFIHQTKVTFRLLLWEANQEKKTVQEDYGSQYLLFSKKKNPAIGETF